LSGIEIDDSYGYSGPGKMYGDVRCHGGLAGAAFFVTKNYYVSHLVAERRNVGLDYIRLYLQRDILSSLMPATQQKGALLAGQ
jgi:hypothetical protein